MLKVLIVSGLVSIASSSIVVAVYHVYGNAMFNKNNSEIEAKYKSKSKIITYLECVDIATKEGADFGRMMCANRNCTTEQMMGTSLTSELLQICNKEAGIN